MKRIQLFEFEDFDWFPAWIRSSMTNLIVVIHKLLGTKEVIAGLLSQIKKKHNFSRVVDMGAGSGGIMPAVIQLMNEQHKNQPVELLLTDLYPNPQFVNYINKGKLKNISYDQRPLDATNLSQAPKGLKTMVNSFHHMPPEQAKKILKSAQENQEPLLVYEMVENKMPLLLWWLFLPLSLTIVFIMALLLTPFSKPLSWKQIVFTYLIPIIPIFYAWDGQASMPRIYTFGDINELLEEARSESYTWEVATAKKADGKSLGYYILGLPK